MFLVILAPSRDLTALRPSRGDIAATSGDPDDSKLKDAYTA
jgi:hypothetical protein